MQVDGTKRRHLTIALAILLNVMQFERHNFLVAGHKIAWGKTLTEVEAILCDEQSLSPYGGLWPNLRLRCKDAYSFPATEFNARAPARNKPVMQVIFELAPPDKNSRSTNPDFWMQILNESLGKPNNISGSRMPRLFSSSDSVSYCATWNIGDVRLTLSVYGGLRESEAGIHAAGLFIDWANEIEAAKPFLAHNRILENELETNSHNNKSVSIFNIDSNQKPFYHRDYYLPNPHIALKDELLRNSQRALYKSRLLETPAIIKKRLRKNQIALWRMGGEPRLVVSTLWDSVIIKSKETNEIEWVNLLPAKGIGAMRLDVNGLQLEDTHNSKKLSSLVHQIEEFLGYSIQCIEEYDE